MRRGGLVVTLFSLAACAKGAESDKAGAAADTAATPAAVATPGGGAAGGGTIAGTVAFDGPPPTNPTIDMSEEQACVGKYSGKPVDPVVMVTDGKLGNVVVFVKSGLPAGQTYPVPAQPVVIDQQGCLYHPRAMAVMTGQKLEIRNGDPVLHNIKAVPVKNRGFNISQPREGMTTTRTFSTEEVTVPIECNVHGWMHANVAVLPHPFSATTKADGSYTIHGLPPGTYEVEARHEALGTKTSTVTVPANGSASADFTFTPTKS